MVCIWWPLEILLWIWVMHMTSSYWMMIQRAAKATWTSLKGNPTVYKVSCLFLMQASASGLVILCACFAKYWKLLGTGNLLRLPKELHCSWRRFGEGDHTPKHQNPFSLYQSETFGAIMTSVSPWRTEVIILLFLRTCKDAKPSLLVRMVFDGYLHLIIDAHTEFLVYKNSLTLKGLRLHAVY